jgi:rubrerythrin
MYSLGRDFLTVQIETKLRETFSFVDEYLSFQIERRLTLLLQLINKVEELASLKKKVTDLIEEEQKHRRNIKSKLIPELDQDNETFSYWDSIFKKYTQGILYLDIRTKDEKSKTLQLLYSIAAGVAMFLSLLVGLWVANFFEENSMSFIFALAVAYIFKDRMKESIRGFSNNAVRVLFADRKYDVYDQKSKKKIGECKSNVNFINWNDVPAEVLNIRESSNKFSIEHEGKPEVVMKMKKTTKLFTDNIDKYHQRHGDIHDLFRFNVKHFIQYADDPFNIEYSWIPDLGKVREIHCAKVYHINIIFKMQIYFPGKEDKTYYKKVRVILDQQGIKRVEEPEYRV